jgi:hypothetical protein
VVAYRLLSIHLARSPVSTVEVLLGVLREEHARLKGTELFEDVVTAKGTLNVRATEWRMWSVLGDGGRGSSYDDEERDLLPPL